MDRWLPWNLYGEFAGRMPMPVWSSDGRAFAYLSHLKGSQRCWLVESHTGRRQFAFDVQNVLTRMRRVLQRTEEAAETVLIRSLARQRNRIEVQALGHLWRLDATGRIVRLMEECRPPHWLVSPDRQCAIYSIDCNLWLWERSTRRVRALTRDGRRHAAYAKAPDADTRTLEGLVQGAPNRTIARWSPNSRYVATHRLLEDGVRRVGFLRAAPPQQPSLGKMYELRIPLPGDEAVAMAEMFIIDAVSGKRVALQMPAIAASMMTPLERHFAWWSEDSTTLYTIAAARGDREIELWRSDAHTGRSELLLGESSNTHIDVTPTLGGYPNVWVSPDGEALIWFSERDGWGHLYAYGGRRPRLRRQLTQGDWLVLDLLHVDPSRDMALIGACGREMKPDPYFGYIYRLQLSTGALTRLSREGADHFVPGCSSRSPPWFTAGRAHLTGGISPCGKFLVEIASRCDAPPVARLVRTDGSGALELERASVAPLRRRGWRAPTAFTVKARDGVTPLYGALWLPSIRKQRRCPIIDIIYAGPHMLAAPKSFLGSRHDYLQVLRDAGFAVLTLDGLGTPYRSKRFHDFSYGNMSDGGGIADHVAALKQLAKRFPCLDLSRVAIHGHSQGAFAATRAALQRPDVFRVAVASAGNYDMRATQCFWAEKYQGLPAEVDYDSVDNNQLCGRKSGPMLLAYGDLDENAPPALTLRFADSLQKGGHDLRLLPLADRNHHFKSDAVFQKSAWAFLVSTLGSTHTRGSPSSRRRRYK